MKLEEKQNIEIYFWKNSVTESPESDSIDNLIGKMAGARVFLDCLRKFNSSFLGKKTILELGGGKDGHRALLKN